MSNQSDAPNKITKSKWYVPIFYQKYWDLVRSDVINYVLNVLNVGALPSGLNETYICLIPKVKNPPKSH